HRRLPVLHRDAVRARVGAEVLVERAVLLHDHDDVLDLVDALLPVTRATPQHRTRKRQRQRARHEAADAPPAAARAAVSSTDDPCRKRLGFAVTPAVAPATWRSPAWPRNCHVISHT